LQIDTTNGGRHFPEWPASALVCAGVKTGAANSVKPGEIAAILNRR
jgi:hypothetical protein